MKFAVIGGSSGIGKAIVKNMAEKGYEVFASYHSQVPDFQHDNIEWVQWSAADNALNLGELQSPIHGVVYCPGTIVLKPFQRIKLEEFKRDLEINCYGAISILQQFFPFLKLSDSASVVLFSSVAVETGMPFHTAVSISKGAIQGLVKALAAEWSPNIRVNAIAPSLTETSLAASFLSSQEKKEAAALRHPLKRILSADEVAALAMFLLSAESSGITGQIFKVDNGIGSLRV